MGKSYESLREGIRMLGLDGKSPHDMRLHFLKMGWDLSSVDQTLWQLKIRDSKNSIFKTRVKRAVFALLLVMGFCRIGLWNFIS